MLICERSSALIIVCVLNAESDENFIFIKGRLVGRLVTVSSLLLWERPVSRMSLALSQPPLLKTAYRQLIPLLVHKVVVVVGWMGVLPYNGTKFSMSECIFLFLYSGFSNLPTIGTCYSSSITHIRELFAQDIYNIHSHFRESV